MKRLIKMAENGIIPDPLMRIGIRSLLRERIHLNNHRPLDQVMDYKQGFIHSLDHSPLAIETGKANEQHYEVSPEFYHSVLGKHLKYSSCYFAGEDATLDEAEAAMLALTCQRAEIGDGMEILELGCGWGSLTLWMAERYPKSRITAVSNSGSQKQFIEQQCRERNLQNVSVITCDINRFDIEHRFDRVVSVEMFEHLRNYRQLFKNIARWLLPDGKLFVHIFTHKSYPYFFETDGDNDWMGRYFFTGGMMPSDDLPLYFQNALEIEEHWNINGTHYSRTAEAWLQKLDRNRKAVLDLFVGIYGEDQKHVWFNRWRMFFMSCSELFGYNNGQQWLVSHYRFCNRQSFSNNG